MFTGVREVAKEVQTHESCAKVLRTMISLCFIRKMAYLWIFSAKHVNMHPRSRVLQNLSTLPAPIGRGAIIYQGAIEQVKRYVIQNFISPEFIQNPPRRILSRQLRIFAVST